MSSWKSPLRNLKSGKVSESSLTLESLPQFPSTLMTMKTRRKKPGKGEPSWKRESEEMEREGARMSQREENEAKNGVIGKTKKMMNDGETRVEEVFGKVLSQLVVALWLTLWFEGL